MSTSPACADGKQTRLQIVNPSPGAVYTGVSNAFQRIAKAEGLGSLWRGVSSVVLGAGTASVTMKKEYEEVDTLH